MRNQILSMGEAVVDVLPSGGGLWKPVAGGSSYNVALALGRLGAPCAFLGRLSRDEQGERMLRGLQSGGVDTSRCARDGRPSPLSVVSSGSETTNVDYTIYIEGTAHAPPELPADWLDGAAHLHVSSFSAIAGEWGDAVESALESAAGVVSTSFDINIRPNLIPARTEALALIERRLSLVGIVKASDEDLRWLLPELEPLEAAAAWASRFSCLVVLTQGAGGASAFFGGMSVHSPAVTTRDADTVGAGDCFVAAFLARAYDDGSLSSRSIADSQLTDRLAFANAAAALCCSRRGAEPATRAEIEAFRYSF